MSVKQALRQIYEGTPEFPIRLFAVAANGKYFGAGSRYGWVGMGDRGGIASEADVRPQDKRKASERELQSIALGQSMDLLYCATTVDSLALAPRTADLAWSYRQKRSWAFLPSLPQGSYMAGPEEWVVSYSSGEMSMFDRKGRVLESGFFERAPQSLTWNFEMSLVYGSDGHTVFAWPRDSLAGVVTPVFRGRNYGLVASTDGSTLFVRGDSKITCIETSSGNAIFEFEIESGLPSMASDPEGGRIAHLSGETVVIRGRAGEVLDRVECPEDMPLGLATLGEDLLIGSRTGSIYCTSW